MTQPAERSRLELAMEIVAPLAVLASFAALATSWGALPERVPKHFDASGLPDAYGGKANLVTLPLLALALYVALTLSRRMSPQRFNYPFAITPENAAAQYRIARSALTTVKATLTVHLAVGTYQSVQTALGRSEGLGVWHLPSLLIVLSCVFVSYGVAAYRQR